MAPLDNAIQFGYIENCADNFKVKLICSFLAMRKICLAHRSPDLVWKSSPLHLKGVKAMSMGAPKAKGLWSL